MNQAFQSFQIVCWGFPPQIPSFWGSNSGSFSKIFFRTSFLIHHLNFRVLVVGLGFLYPIPSIHGIFTHMNEGLFSVVFMVNIPYHTWMVLVVWISLHHQRTISTQFLEDHPNYYVVSITPIYKPFNLGPCGRGPTTRSLGDLLSPWLLTTYIHWDDPPFSQWVVWDSSFRQAHLPGLWKARNPWHPTERQSASSIGDVSTPQN